MTKDGIVRLARQLEREADKAHDLWTWLPSCKIAETFHGDYALNHTPDPASIMEEACIYISSLLSGEEMEPYWNDASGYFDGCPCGESHEKEGE